MKITILQGAFNSLPPYSGGAVEKRWQKMAEAFASAGHEVTHISRQNPAQKKQEQVNGVQHIRLKGYDTPGNIVTLKFLDLLYTLRCRNYLPSAEVIVTNTFWAPLVVPKTAGSIIVDVARIPKGQLKLYKRAAVFRANSTAVVNAICTEDPSYQKRTTLIPNPLPFLPDRPANLKMKEKRLLFVGRLHPEKGIELLLKTFYSMLDKGMVESCWELDLVGPSEVGSGGGGVDYINSLKKRFMHENIHWHEPEYETKLLNAYYQRASIFVYPSLAEQGETFGLAPLEAMSWGCIPIVSDLACFKDFITNEENGCIFDHRSASPQSSLEEAILKIVSGEKSALMHAATAVRQSHSLERISQQFITLFKQLCHE